MILKECRRILSLSPIRRGWLKASQPASISWCVSHVERAKASKTDSHDFSRGCIAPKPGRDLPTKQQGLWSGCHRASCPCTYPADLPSVSSQALSVEDSGCCQSQQVLQHKNSKTHPGTPQGTMASRSQTRPPESHSSGAAPGNSVYLSHYCAGRP